MGFTGIAGRGAPKKGSKPALEPTTIDALSDAMRAPPAQIKVGAPGAPRTTSSARKAGNRGRQDELRASRGLLRETTDPGTGAGS